MEAISEPPTNAASDSSEPARTWWSHASAEVEEGADIGPGTKVWHHAHVRDSACVGSDSTIGKNVYLDAGVVVGSRVKIQNNVSVFHGVRIADDVFLGPSCVFTNDLFPRASAVDWQVVDTHVARGASVGANATIVCGTRIGEWAMVGAGSVVTHDVGDHQLVLGNPARLAGWVCKCGRVLTRESSRPDDLRSCTGCREVTS